MSSHALQIIKDAYAVQSAYRARISSFHPADAAPQLLLLAACAGGECKGLDHPCPSAQPVADEAYKLGVGVLIAEYLARRANGDHSLLIHPMATPFKLLADRAVNALLKYCADCEKWRAVPELRSAYEQLAALIDELQAVIRSDMRWHLRLPPVSAPPKAQHPKTSRAKRVSAIPA